MKLLVIVLNYGVTDLTIECLKSAAPETATIPDLKIAICENGSGGDAEDRLRRAISENGWAAWAELTAVSPNRGFTGGNNIIIRKWLRGPDRPDYFLLLNADTLVRPGAFRALVDFMDRNPAVGIAGSHLEYPDGSRQGSPFRFPGAASEFERGLRWGPVSKLLARWSVAAPLSPIPCQVDWVAGASMIIRREVVERIGPLDEGLYTYFDDVDYCMNARRAGWQTWYVPESRVMHYGGQSTGVSIKERRRPEYWFQSRRRFFLKNYGALHTALIDAAFLLGFCLWRVRRMLQGKPDTDPPHMLFDSLRHSVFLAGFKVRDVENPALRTT